jgi:hypothetical protein
VVGSPSALEPYLPIHSSRLFQRIQPRSPLGMEISRLLLSGLLLMQPELGV